MSESTSLASEYSACFGVSLKRPKNLMRLCLKVEMKDSLFSNGLSPLKNSSSTLAADGKEASLRIRLRV